jgi:hypothetical protein
MSPYVRFEVFTAVTMKNGVFCDVTPCGSTASHVSISQILVTLMMETLGSSETSALTRVTRHNIPEDVIIQTDICYCKIFNLYNPFTVWNYFRLRPFHRKENNCKASLVVTL